MHTLRHQYIFLLFVSNHGKQGHGKQNRKKSVEFTKGVFSTHNKVCRFEIIDGVKYVYCIKHAHKFLLREQVRFAALL